MTQRTDAYTLLRSLWLRSRSVGLAQLLVLQSLSWIGVFSLFNSNAVLAQTESSIDVVVPTTTSKPPAAPVVKSVPNAPVRVERLRQKLSPTPVRVRSSRQVATPVTPRLSVPKVRVAQPATTSPKSVQARPNRTRKAATNATANDNGAYIDPTEYKIGATRSYQPPSAVVLSERSTGCKAIARQGMSGSICGTPARRTQKAIAASTLR